jgi:hypothetical protein
LAFALSAGVRAVPLGGAARGAYAQPQQRRRAWLAHWSAQLVNAEPRACTQTDDEREQTGKSLPQRTHSTTPTRTSIAAAQKKVSHENSRRIFSLNKSGLVAGRSAPNAQADSNGATV